MGLLPGRGDDGVIASLAGTGRLRDAGDPGTDQVGLAAVLHVHREGHDDSEVRCVFRGNGGRVAAIGSACPGSVLVALLHLDGGRHAVDVHGGSAFGHGVTHVPREGHRAVGTGNTFRLVGLGQTVTVRAHLRVDTLVDDADRVGQRVGLGVKQERPLAALHDQVTVTIDVDGGAVVVRDCVGLEIDLGNGWRSGRLSDSRASQAEHGQGSEQKGLQVHDSPLNWEVTGVPILA